MHGTIMPLSAPRCMHVVPVLTLSLRALREQKATQVELVGDCSGTEYPLQKKRHTLVSEKKMHVSAKHMCMHDVVVRATRLCREPICYIIHTSCIQRVYTSICLLTRHVKRLVSMNIHKCVQRNAST
jgi:hypothetical protein